jgi:hypothetical protein
MTCEHCGSVAVELVDETGGTKSGRFVEKYECVDCGARGRISGRAAAPAREWSRTGQLFTGGGSA